MINPAVKDFISGVTLGTTPGVTRPTVKAPSPFDNEEVDRRYEKFGITRYTDPSSYSSAGSGAYSQTDGTDPYRGPLSVSGMTQSVADQFVGMDKKLGAAISPLGFNPLISAGSFISKKNLENIEKNIAEGNAGYALGMLDGKIIGVSPGPFGGSVLSGVLPSGLSAEQRKELTSNLLSTREIAENPKDFAVSPTPTPESTDAEMASAGSANIVTDSSGRPVTQGGDPSSSGYGSYVTTGQGQYVDPSVIQDQGNAMTAAAEAAAPYANMTDDDFNPSDPGGSGGSTSQDFSAPSYDYDDFSGTPFASGGEASKDPVQSTGFVDGPPQNYAKGTTVADTENHRVRVGSFVLNAPTTERLQKEGKLPKGPQKRKAAKGGKMMEVALSKGEYVIDADDIGKFGGYDALNKENDKGKPEVERRQAAAQGGFLGRLGLHKGGVATHRHTKDQVEPLELEYTHGKSEFDGTYNRPPLSPEAQALLDAAEAVHSERSAMYSPFAAKDRSGMIDAATEMTGIDSMRRFKSLGYDKLFPAADADTITKLTSLPDIIFDDSFDPDPFTFGYYQRSDDEIKVFPERLNYLNRNIYGQDPADNYKLRALPLELLYGWSVENTAFHELLHSGYAKQVRRNLPFASEQYAEMATNMGGSFAYRNYAPPELAKKVDDAVEKTVSLPEGSKEREKARERHLELYSEAALYEPDQNHSAMMFYEIDRIRAETQDLSAERRIIARQQIASRAFQYLPDAMKKGNVDFRQKILSRPEFKDLKAALFDSPSYFESEMNEYGSFRVNPKLYADLAINNPELRVQLDNFTTEYLEAMQEVHGNYSSQFRAALQAQDVNDLPLGSEIRKRAEANLREQDAMGKYPSYFLYKNRYQAYPLDKRQDGFLDIPDSSATR